jgi:hypothetical protein
MTHSAVKEIIDNVCIIVSLALVGGFLLVAGSMIGQATAHDNRVEHDRQFHCLEMGGELKFVGQERVCTK